MPNSQRSKITLKRSYRATLEEVWDLWTTRDGIESWWGPDGFAVTVRHLDLRVGGELRYTMTASDPERIAFMEQAGMPTANDLTITYTEVDPLRRLGYFTMADFVPGLDPYEIATTVVLEREADRVHLELTFDAMHDDEWTQRAVMGHESELDRLGKILEDAG